MAHAPYPPYWKLTSQTSTEAEFTPYSFLFLHNTVSSTHITYPQTLWANTLTLLPRDARNNKAKRKIYDRHISRPSPTIQEKTLPDMVFEGDWDLVGHSDMFKAVGVQALRWRHYIRLGRSGGVGDSS
ncbi:hypothetical protein VTL71DRAFT_16024 [Oculimacula yallundae]|uniref:Uncharacterized protein n=1 Tax=Oculimacula yallundae TaxID=86028 RepID=A0ABR4CEN1_9HELO